MKVLVTGACGFIGSHLTEALIRAGFETKAFVFYNSFNSLGWLDHCDEEVRGKFEVFAGDIRDPNGVKTAMKNCDAVLHLAALIGIPYSYVSPLAYIRTNVEGTFNVLESSKNSKLDQILITSTSETYGSAKYIPMDENHPKNPTTTYAAGKLSADQAVLSYFKMFNLDAFILRPFNNYGPNQLISRKDIKIILILENMTQDIFLKH